MKTNKKIITLFTCLLLLLITSCSMPSAPLGIALLPESTKAGQSHTVAKRFEEPAEKGPTTLESVIELSEKYSRLSEQMTSLQEQHQNTIAENKTLKNQLAAGEAQLKQTQRELAEANDLLIEMRIELNNWKTDILGFRTEMREAEKAQLEALLKILKTLGGETKTESAKTQNTTTPVAKDF